MSLFNDKYRNESARLRGWDYRWPAAYFITICTKNRLHHFGEIYHGEAVLTDAGRLAWDFWIEIPQHFSFVSLDAFVVMPNHVHGIIIIEEYGGSILNESQRPSVIGKNEEMSRISPKTGSISSIIRSYKSAVTKHVRPSCPDFDWQPRFHDHIIRDQPSFDRIQQYIINNPQKWQDDMFNGDKK